MEETPSPSKRKPKIYINELRRQTRMIIEHLTSLYAVPLRQHTKRTKIKRNLRQKDLKLISELRRITQWEFGKTLNHQQELSLVASIYRLHIWEKAHNSTFSKAKWVLKAYDRELTDSDIGSLFQEADQMQKARTNFSLKGYKLLLDSMLLKCGKFLIIKKGLETSEMQGVLSEVESLMIN